MHVSVTLDVCHRAESLSAGRYLSGHDLCLHRSQPAPPTRPGITLRPQSLFIPAIPANHVAPSCQDVPAKTRPLKTQVQTYLDTFVLADDVHFHDPVSVDSPAAHLGMTNTDTLLVELMRLA